MQWKAYRLVYQLKSSLHIGWHTLGYINLTRHYIPGKNMWASFTDNLTRSKKEEKGLGGYEKYGKLLKDGALLSYFYPSFDAVKPLLPRYTDKGLFYGAEKMPVSEFEKLSISSFGKTAIMPESNTKLDESLHEMEFIAPRFDSIYFIGYVFIAENATGPALDSEVINTIFNEIFVGGERKYGWGRLKLYGRPTEAAGKFFGHDFYGLANNRPEITVRCNDYLPAHLELDDAANLKIKGSIETVVGREWIPNDGLGDVIGPGRRISNATLCWTPGSQYCGKDSALQNDVFQIGEYGILKKL